MFCATWRHVCVPIGCGVTDARYDFLDPRSSDFIAVPTLLDQLPQGVGDPDGLCICRFIGADTEGDVVREFQGFNITKWLLSSQDLIEYQEKHVDRDSTTRSPEE
jgi:hypothetical protein